jgi:phosphoglycolate phosphatase-like HAD superfamily hydrolase
VTLPVWRIHCHMGMGGDQLVSALGGEDLERKCGDAIRSSEKGRYAEVIDEVRPLPDARRLVVTLEERGHAVVLVSSAKQSELDHYLELLDIRDVVEGWTSSADVDATKPEPDLVLAGLEKAGGGKAVMLGDSTWDCISARRADVETVALRTGGYCEDELRAAGAAMVFETLADVIDRLDETPFASV